MKKLLRHDIFHLGLLAGIFATMAVILAAGVVLLWSAPWVVPFGQKPLSPQQIAMLRWNQQGFPVQVPVRVPETAEENTCVITGTLTSSRALRMSDVAFDGYKIWVTGTTECECTECSGSVFYFDPRNYDETPKQIVLVDRKDPRGILFDGQNIWVANRGDGTVSCIPITSPGMVGSPVHHTLSGDKNSSPYYLAFDGQYVWVTLRDTNELWRLRATGCPKTDGSDEDKDTKIIIKNGKEEIKLSKPFGIIFDGTYIWVANRGSNEVIRLDPGQCNAANCEEARVVPVGDQGSQPANLAYDGTFVWVTLQGTDQVARIEAETGWVIKPFIDVGRQPWGIAYDGANIWVANNWDESVSRLRAADGSLIETFETGGAASRFAFDGTFMWVANYGEDDASSFLTRR